ncbi:hypothetical protein GC163_00960 [bacterium]|nr:hypothetical protein [bacterium]
MTLAADSMTEPFLGSYAPRTGLHDEYFAAPQDAHAVTHRFVHELGQWDREELERRRETAWRQIDENSVTYSSTGVAEQTNRPWIYDPLPLVIGAREWQSVSTALAQRARLLNLLLQDLYGAQKTLNRGLLPPGLIFSHPGFLRVFHGIRVPDDVFLHLYAADLARAADGRWWVFADRTEAPSGMGYTIENRLVSSSMFPESFRANQVDRLAPFFIALRELMQRLAARHRDNPRIVLLSQGPANPNYFEDAYLARYLGYTLVEGEDLAVRNQEVLLKTLGGLLPVDVLLRRVDEGDCDPLELRSDSVQGVTGLMQSIRSGMVTTANALGSGLLESPALPAFLPRLCKELLDEDLLMPSVATWWCGTELERNYVLEHLDQLVIRHCYLNHRTKPQFGDQLSRSELEKLRQQILTRPGDYVAQERVQQSTCPVWLGERPEPWHVALRTYLVSSGRSYLCLPGGLVRSSPQSHTLDLSISQGEASKDAWVLAAGPVAPISLLKPPGYIQELKRSGAELPSRVADNLFWLGRHVERAEGAARLLRTFVNRLLGESGNSPEIPLLIRALAELGQIEPGYVVENIRAQLPPIESALPCMIFDESESFGLRANIQRLNRTASLVRERLSLDSWRLINRVYHEFEPEESVDDVELTQLQSKLNGLITNLSAFSGLIAESMTRTLGWRFLDIGRRLERSMHTVFAIHNLLLPDSEKLAPALEAALEFGDCVLTYRSRYLTTLQLAPVLDLLVTDESNPRSLAFQLACIVEHLEQFPRDNRTALRSSEQRLGMAALHAVRMLSADDLVSVHTSNERRGLDRLLTRIAAMLPKLADAVSHKYLIHAGESRQLTELRIRSSKRLS